jgi:hypothetical protein
MGDGFEMYWVAAMPDAAEMVQFKAGRDRAEYGRIGDTVDVGVALIVSAYPDLSVPVSSPYASLPQPTRSEIGTVGGDGASLVDPSPEAIKQWCERVFRHAPIIGNPIPT